jgi:lysophospholipid acyltransferase (LPLAT)-like uncharacterized protein
LVSSLVSLGRSRRRSILVRELAGRVVGWVLRLWTASWRVTVVDDTSGHCDVFRPMVLCFWHGAQMALLGWRCRGPTAVLVSWSSDGTIQAGVMRSLGMTVVRGSGSRGASSGLHGIVRQLRRGADAAFAVDGPRGPLHDVQPGAAAAAQLGRARLVPMAAAARPLLVLGRTWDKFWVVPPFSRVTVAFGRPVDPAEARDDPGLLAAAIEAAQARASGALREHIRACAVRRFLRPHRR